MGRSGEWAIVGSVWVQCEALFPKITCFLFDITSDRSDRYLPPTAPAKLIWCTPKYKHRARPLRAPPRRLFGEVPSPERPSRYSVRHAYTPPVDKKLEAKFEVRGPAAEEPGGGFGWFYCVWGCLFMTAF